MHPDPPTYPTRTLCGGPPPLPVLVPLSWLALILPPFPLAPTPPAAFVAARHPGAWRETLAAILTSAPYDQFEGLLSALAGRLAAAGERRPGLCLRVWLPAGVQLKGLLTALAGRLAFAREGQWC